MSIPFAILAPLALVAAVLAGDPQKKPARDDAAAEKLGWRLGVQTWTFRDRTAFEAIDTAAKLGVKYIELYPGQTLSKETGDVKLGVDMPAEQVAKLQARLKEKGVAPWSFGVVSFTNDEAAARKIFAFGKTLGLKNISCEPEPDAVDLCARLADEYGINLALHDHPKPSRYWSPDVVLETVKGRTKRFGACADTGHWKRSGLVPVECLKQLEGRIHELHFKDIEDGIDQPWGTGACDAKGILAELSRQKFEGLISIEYETGEGVELDQNVAKCIAFFDATAREVLAARAKD